MNFEVLQITFENLVVVAVLVVGGGGRGGGRGWGRGGGCDGVQKPI